MSLFDFKNFIKTLDVDQLHECHCAISDQIRERVSHDSTKGVLNSSASHSFVTPNSSVSHSHVSPETPTKSVSDYVEYNDSFLTPDERDMLLAEAASFNFSPDMT